MGALNSTGAILCLVDLLIPQAILTYGVLFMDWGRENTPFQGVSVALTGSHRMFVDRAQIRKWFNETKDSILAAGQPTRPNLGPSSTVNPSASPLQPHSPR